VPDDAEGVLTATIWSDKDVPLAERLMLFRAPQHPLKISIKADKKSYIPGDKAKLTVRATDENDKPVAAVVGVTVTDDSVLRNDREARASSTTAGHGISRAGGLRPGRRPCLPRRQKLKSRTGHRPALGHARLAPLCASWTSTKFVEENGDKARRVVALKIQAQHEVMRKP
jgi:hypothetical protein